VRDDEPRVLRRSGQLRLDDGRERQVAERAAALPALVALVRDDPLRPRGRVQVGERRQPVDAREAVALLATRLGVEEVVGEDTRIALVESERPQAAVDVLGAQLWTSGSGLTMPIPCSRFVSATASARAKIARETSASGSASTIG
jgi:hypothetical protein